MRGPPPPYAAPRGPDRRATGRRAQGQRMRWLLRLPGGPTRTCRRSSSYSRRRRRDSGRPGPRSRRGGADGRRRAVADVRLRGPCREHGLLRRGPDVLAGLVRSGPWTGGSAGPRTNTPTYARPHPSHTAATAERWLLAAGLRPDRRTSAVVIQWPHTLAIYRSGHPGWEGPIREPGRRADGTVRVVRGTHPCRPQNRACRPRGRGMAPLAAARTGHRPRVPAARRERPPCQSAAAPASRGPASNTSCRAHRSPPAGPVG